MTREKFIKVLEKKRYYYEIEGDKIIVTDRGYVNLRSLKTLPPGVEFKNGCNVWLDKLETLPPGVEFNNYSWIPHNGGNVYLMSLKTIPPGVEFNNVGDVNLESLIGGYLHKWNGNIEGIDSNMLLNSMISKGMFI